ncbi:Uncharacterised protein [Vibrio cholerae]|nr:Uncharacterised protein [Vibrio cholerae]
MYFAGRGARLPFAFVLVSPDSAEISASRSIPSLAICSAIAANFASCSARAAISSASASLRS